MRIAHHVQIGAASTQRVVEAPDNDQAEYWLRLLRELDSARVSTIHSFCASLLRSHAVGGLKFIDDSARA